jgi:hypothetical protein
MKIYLLMKQDHWGTTSVVSAHFQETFAKVMCETVEDVKAEAEQLMTLPVFDSVSIETKKRYVQDCVNQFYLLPVEIN